MFDLLLVIAISTSLMALESVVFAILRIRNHLRDRATRNAAEAKAERIAALVEAARAEGRPVEEIQQLVNDALG